MKKNPAKNITGNITEMKATYKNPANLEQKKQPKLSLIPFYDLKYRHFSKMEIMFEIIRCFICLVWFKFFVFQFIRSSYYYHADSFYDSLPLIS